MVNYRVNFRRAVLGAALSHWLLATGSLHWDSGSWLLGLWARFTGTLGSIYWATEHVGVKRRFARSYWSAKSTFLGDCEL